MISILGLSILCTSTWAVNKCKGIDGRVIYQDAPCAGAEKVNLSGAGQADPTSQASNYWKKESARLAYKERVQTAIVEGKVFIGMTADEVRQSWGSPTKINSSIGSYGKHDQWVYERAQKGTQYVYLENGTVTSMQSPE